MRHVKIQGFDVIESTETYDEACQEHRADALIRQYINALVSNKPDEAANVTRAMVDYVYTTPQPAPGIMESRSNTRQA